MRRQVRNIRLDQKVRKVRREESRHEENESEPRSMAQGTYGKSELITKASGLMSAMPTASELKKGAEKAIATVVSAIRHVFTEGDVTIPNLGTLSAALVKGQVRVTLTAAKQLEHCVVARLTRPQPSPVLEPSVPPAPPTAPEPSQGSTPQPNPSPAPIPAPVPDPAPAPEPQPIPAPSSGQTPEPQTAPEPSPSLTSTPEPQVAADPVPAPELVSAPSPDSVLDDVARGKQAMAPLSASGYPISNVVDGNPDTKWVSGFNVPCWLNIQLGSAYRVKRIIARAPENLTMSYRIKGCIVGHPIQELIVVPSASGVMMWDNLDFVISVIEVWFDASSHPSQWVEFIELEVYGVPAQ